MTGHHTNVTLSLSQLGPVAVEAGVATEVKHVAAASMSSVPHAQFMDVVDGIAGLSWPAHPHSTSSLIHALLATSPLRSVVIDLVDQQYRSSVGLIELSTAQPSLSCGTVASRQSHWRTPIMAVRLSALLPTLNASIIVSSVEFTSVYNQQPHMEALFDTGATHVFGPSLFRQDYAAWIAQLGVHHIDILQLIFTFQFSGSLSVVSFAMDDFYLSFDLRANSTTHASLQWVSNIPTVCSTCHFSTQACSAVQVLGVPLFTANKRVTFVASGALDRPRAVCATDVEQ